MPNRPPSPRPPVRPVTAKGGRAAVVAGGLVLSVATLGIAIYQASGGYVPYRGADTSTEAALSTSHFTPVTVTSSRPSDRVGLTKLISLKVPKHLKPETGATEPIFSIYLKDSDIQVERPYTPLKGIDEDGEMLFWVKRYDHGEVGRWFQRRAVGETVEIRGPVKTVDWRDGEWDEVVLISGGTGITPFYQLLHRYFVADKRGSSIAGGDGPQPTPIAPRNTHFTLMHASSTAETLPPPEILDDLREWEARHPEQLTLKLFVDKNGGGALAGVTQARIDSSSIDRIRQERGLVKTASWLEWIRGAPQKKDADKKVLFMVCGPESMITAISGSRLARPSSHVGGILGNMGYTASEVRKL